MEDEDRNENDLNLFPEEIFVDFVLDDDFDS